MRKNQMFVTSVVLVFLTTLLHAECPEKQDHRSNKQAGILITDFTVSGTQTFGTDELGEITSKLTGSCFNEDSEELGERVRDLFQDRGYFAVEVKNLHIKLSDATTVPKPAILEAEILEGPRFRLAGINFTGNHAFSADELRGRFPAKNGDLFSRDRVGSGLDSVRQVYVSKGFIDFLSIPNSQFSSDGTVGFSLTVIEGTQYHMGKLEIIGKKEIADRLRAEWQLPEGAIFDVTYLDKYVDRNGSLLPPEFQRSHVQIVRDCPNAVVEVRLPLDATDPRSQSPPKDTKCDPPKQSE